MAFQWLAPFMAHRPLIGGSDGTLPMATPLCSYGSKSVRVFRACLQESSLSLVKEMQEKEALWPRLSLCPAWDSMVHKTVSPRAGAAMFHGLKVECC